MTVCACRIRPGPVTHLSERFMWNVVQELLLQRCINDTLYQFILNYFKYPSIWNYLTLTTLGGVQVEQVELQLMQLCRCRHRSVQIGIGNCKVMHIVTLFSLDNVNVDNCLNFKHFKCPKDISGHGVQAKYEYGEATIFIFPCYRYNSFGQLKTIKNLQILGELSKTSSPDGDFSERFKPPPLFVTCALPPFGGFAKS